MTALGAKEGTQHWKAISANCPKDGCFRGMRPNHAMLNAVLNSHVRFVVAGGAWVLQSDGSGKVGASFPATNTWLGLILDSISPSLLCVIPFDAAIDLPKMEALEVFSSQTDGGGIASSAPFNFLTLYFGICIILTSLTIWQWLRLQKLPLMPSAEPDIFTTAAGVPPLTFSWPRRAVVIPSGLDTQAVLIAHERAHLRYNDAELTLFFLFLRDLMFFNPGIGYLVRQRRLAIELRADHEATRHLSASERKDYASLLLDVVRPDGGRTGRGTLPCPTAHLASRGHRNAKMRLTGIMKNEPGPRKHRWSAALLLSTLGASLIGFFNSSALAKIEVLDVDLNPIEYAMQTPPQLPASCPGLKKDDVKFEKTTSTVNGKIVPQYVAKLGVVVLKHDVRRDGSAHNPHVEFSTHPCFDASAKTAIAGWTAESQEFEIKNVAVKMHFVTSAETLEELDLKLDDFLQ